jgi:hypothetical protein
MVFPTMPSRIASAAVACVLATTTAFAACAAASVDATAAAQASQRVVVKLVRGSVDGAAIAAEATRVAGVPVSYAAAVSTSWHALALQCGGAASCDAAIARLRAADSIYQAVELESRKTRSAS